MTPGSSSLISVNSPFSTVITMPSSSFSEEIAVSPTVISLTVLIEPSLNVKAVSSAAMVASFKTSTLTVLRV